MNQLAPLIQDLGIILITAAVTSLIFKKLKQPLILGYMLAGLLIGPHAAFFPNVTDHENVQVWAEMGVIFMLFALGIEFSFRKIAQLGSTVMIVGFFEVSAMCAMGFMVGKLLGWTHMQSFFLGSMLSISSTSVIFKAFDELKLKTKRFAQLVFGILIIEDLAAVLLIVLLTTLGLSRQFEGMDLLWTIGKLSFYLAWWVVGGLFLIPWVLKAVKNLLSDEILLIVSIGLCLMMVVAAAQVGFSPALGAFIMGAILGETSEKEKIEKIFQPVKNLFSAVFFVSVGMMIRLDALVNHPGQIFLFTAILIVGKIYYGMIGTLIAGENMQTAVPVGVSLAQIGEFSFIIAGLGMSLKITDEVLYSNIIAVSALTTFTTPYLVRNRNFFAEKIEKSIPPRIQTILNQYLRFSNLVKASPEWRDLVRSYAFKIFINGVIVTAGFLLSSKFLYPLMEMKSETVYFAQFFTMLLTLLLVSPFLWAMIFAQTRNPQLIYIIESHITPRMHRFFFLSRVLIALSLLSSLLTQYLSIKFVILASIAMFAGLGFPLFRFVGPIYLWLENRFFKQINSEASVHQTRMPLLAPWDAHLSEYELHPESDCIGKSLNELRLRESFGVVIAMIQRGKRHIPAPGREEILMPYDRLSVIGTDDQLSEFENYLNTFYMEVDTEQRPSPASFILDQYVVTENSSLAGKTIRDSGIREKTMGLVIGIERDGRRILNPSTDFVIQVGDLIWIVGERQKLRELA